MKTSVYARRRRAAERPAPRTARPPRQMGGRGLSRWFYDTLLSGSRPRKSPDIWMTAKPVLMLYCQHSLGMGHLVRSFSLAEALSGHFHVLFLNGGPLPEGVQPPAGVEVVQLPAVGMQSGGALISRDGDYPVAPVLAARRQLILSIYQTRRPAVLLIELFPFGRKKFANELLPLLKRAQRSKPVRPVVFCSLRDILVRSRRDQQHHDDRAGWLANRYFDGILVHSDAVFARLEESFKPQRPLRVPVHYTGFVLPNRLGVEQSRRQRRVLVSAGGGRVGGPLYELALTAQPILWRRHRIAMTVIGGPFLPEADWLIIQRRAQNRPGLELYRSVPDLGVLMRQCAVSLSQCGYNTAAELIQSAGPALVIPYAEGREDEQLARARRLERLGAVRILDGDALNCEALVQELVALLEVPVTPTNLDLSGAARTARLVAELASGQSAPADDVRAGAQ